MCTKNVPPPDVIVLHIKDRTGRDGSKVSRIWPSPVLAGETATPLGTITKDQCVLWPPLSVISNTSIISWQVHTEDIAYQRKTLLVPNPTFLIHVMVLPWVPWSGAVPPEGVRSTSKSKVKGNVT